MSLEEARRRGGRHARWLVAVCCVILAGTMFFVALSVLTTSH
jgi:hypothetical protein